MGSSDATTETEYAHLIGDPGGLRDVATCLYFDGIRQDVTLDTLLDVAGDWYERHAHRPKVLIAKTAGEFPRLPRPTIRTLRDKASGQKACDVLETLQVFPRGRSTIDDTWRPIIYFAASMKRPTSLFLSVNATMAPGDVVEGLQQTASLLGSDAAYAFRFPRILSPLAYFWGIVVEPAGRDSPCWQKQKSRRLSHWRDNTSIGIEGDGGRRWYSAGDGYVRDAYPVMLLSPAQLGRQVGSASLQDEILRRKLGALSKTAAGYLWSIPGGKLMEAQDLLDESRISLSACRLETPRQPAD